MAKAKPKTTTTTLNPSAVEKATSGVDPSQYLRGAPGATNNTGDTGNTGAAPATTPTTTPGTGGVQVGGSGVAPTISTNVPVNSAPYMLPPDIANVIIPGEAGTSAAAQAGTKAQPSPAPGSDKLEALLTAYKDAFGKERKLTTDDVRTLQGLDPNLDAQIQEFTSGTKSGSTVMVNGKAEKNLPMTDQLLTGGLFDLFGNKTNPTFSVPQLKRTLATAIAKQLPGLSPEIILSHNPDDVENIPISTQMATSLTSKGYAVQVGDPIGTATDTVQPGDTGAAKAGAAGRTAQDEFNSLMTQWDAASGAQKQAIASALAPLGGLPDPFNVTKTQIEQAYTKIVTTAAQNKISVQQAETNLGVQVQQGETNPQGLQAAETSSQAAEIQQTAERLGVDLSPQEYNYLVDQASVNNPETGEPWTQAQIDQAVGSYFKVPTNPDGSVNAQALGGLAASIYKGFQTILDEYQIPMSDQAVMAHVASSLQSSISGINESSPTDTTSDITAGTSAATASFLQYVQQQAAQLYPQFATQIDQGVTTKTLLDPYAQVAAAVLGFGTATGTSASTSEASDAEASLGINWSQPKWAVALQGGTNPTNGGPAPMSLDQWRQTLITDPQYGWAKTDDAKNAGAAVADHLLSVFGVPAAQGQ